jgi:DNA-binding MarR family transcriptional regulator
MRRPTRLQSIFSIAAELPATSGAMTTALDRLERAGYALRTRDQADRRRVLVQMTPQAAADAGRF